MSLRARASVVLALLASLAACSSSGGAAPGGAATAQQISFCKQSCDKLKFFMCNDAQQQADCYAGCQTASASAIDLFDGCVNNAQCDPSCSTHLTPTAPDGGGGGGSGGGGGGGGDAATTNPGLTACAAACQSLGSFACISATETSNCVSLCNTAQAATRDTFSACVMGQQLSNCSAVGCYYTFNPNAPHGPTPQQVTDCKQACDDLATFSCITPDQQTTCRDTCAAETSGSKIDDFVACVRSSATDCNTSATCTQRL